MIRFFNEDVPYKLNREQQQLTRQWLKRQAEGEGYAVGELNYIFCSDEYILQVNKDYLKHDYYTDIITFDQSEEEGILAGDIFISVERVNDNAGQLGVLPEQEMRRILVHGLLHLCGYGDKSAEEAIQMRAKEEEWLTGLRR